MRVSSALSYGPWVVSNAIVAVGGEPAASVMSAPQLVSTPIAGHCVNGGAALAGDAAMSGTARDVSTATTTLRARRRNRVPAM
jgi:hypothetical protein